MSRKLQIGAFLFLLIVLGSSCGSKNNAPSESKIQKDISEEYSEYCYEGSFQDADIEIEKRQTNAEDKTDYVWGTIVAQTEAIEYRGSFYAEYILYNDGWLLDVCQFSNNLHSIILPEVEEKQIRDGLLPEFESEYCTNGLSVTDLSVTSNWIEDSSMTNYVECTIYVERPEADGQFKISAEYSLNQTSWELSNWGVNDSDCTIYDWSIDQGEIEQAIDVQFGADYDTYEFLSQENDEEWENVRFYYTAKTHNGYNTKTTALIMSCRFSLQYGWGEPEGQCGETYSDWDVIGEWTYKDSRRDIWLNIIYADYESVTYEYTYSTGTSRAASDGPITQEWHYEPENDIEYLTQGDADRESLYKMTGLPYVHIYNAPSPFDDDYTSTTLDHDLEMYIYPDKGVCIETTAINPPQYILSYSNVELADAVISEPGALWPDEVRKLADEAPIYRTNGGFDGGGFSVVGDNTYMNTFSYVDKNNEGAASNTYNLYGLYKTMTGVVFIDEDAPLGEHAYVKIYGDEELLYTYDAVDFTESHSSESFSINVEGVQELTIELTGESYRSSEWLLGGAKIAILYLADLIVCTD